MAMPPLRLLLVLQLWCIGTITSFSIEKPLQPLTFPRVLAEYDKNPISIALTRERSSNTELRELLQTRLPPQLCELAEVPCISFTDGPHKSRLDRELMKADSVVLTSPRGAASFLPHWTRLGRPPIKFATVGSGTSKILKNAGVIPHFEAVDMSAKGISKEFPQGFGHRLLFPTSTIASSVVDSALRKRGIHVTRLHIYNTIPSPWTDSDWASANKTDIVVFASPSAARVWADRVGNNFTAICIGPITFQETQKLGFTDSRHCFTSAGLEALADLISTVVSERNGGPESS